MTKATPKKDLTLAGLSRFSKDLAKEVLKNPAAQGATVIALSGELGAGKTTFTKVFLKNLGVREAVTSPTFILFRPYPLTAAPFVMAYHIDCYRLEDPKELLKLGLKEMLKDPRHLVVIEWAERIKKYLPARTRWIRLEHGKEKAVRTLKIQ